MPFATSSGPAAVPVQGEEIVLEVYPGILGPMKLLIKIIRKFTGHLSLFAVNDHNKYNIAL